jgi:hypothetical protein
MAGNHRPQPTLFSLGLSLIRLHFAGYKAVPGYTVCNRDDPAPGDYYLAVNASKGTNADDKSDISRPDARSTGKACCDRLGLR